MPRPQQRSGLSALPELDRNILVHLNDHPGATAEDVARTVSLSVAAARQHLLRLEYQSFVRHETPRERSKGRPVHLYHLTEAARQLFPQGSTFSLLALLAVLKRDHPDVYAACFEKLHEPFVEQDVGRDSLRGLPLERRLIELRPWIADYGHLAKFKTDADGGEVLVTHCAVLAAARGHPGICVSEARWLRTLFPEFDVEIAETMAAGAPRCRIRFARVESTSEDLNAAG